jgi:hypothetical protein
VFRNIFTETSLLVGAACTLPLAERYFSNAQRLSALGFKRHLVECEHIQFVNDNDFSDSLKIWHEMAKEIVASYCRVPMPLHAHIAGYKSQLLEDLRVKRSKSGLDADWFQKAGTEVWRYYLAPFDQHFEFEKQKNSELWRACNTAFITDLNSATKSEISFFAAALDELAFEEEKGFNLNNADSYHSIKAKLKGTATSVLDGQLTNLGFIQLSSMSRGNRVHFRKKIDSNFALNFIFEFGFQSLLVDLHLSSTEPKENRNQSSLWNNRFEFRIMESVRGLNHFSTYKTLDELIISISAVVSVFKMEQLNIERISELILDSSDI